MKAPQTKRPLASYITNNWGTKLLSLFIAVLVWGYVISATNPIRSKVIYDVPVTVTGLEALHAGGFHLTDDLASLPDVRVTVSCPRTEYASVTASSLEAVIDVSRLTASGTYSLSVRVTSNHPDAAVSSISPSEITLTTDVTAHAEVPIKVRVSGTLPDNLARGEISLSQPTISVSGPALFVSRIAQAVVDVDLGKMTEGYVALLPYRFVDANQNTLNTYNVTSSVPAIRVDMGIVSRKTVAFDFSAAVKNTTLLKEGYAVKSITPSAPSVVLTGPADLLSGISSVTMPDLDLAGTSESIVDMPVQLVLPEGIALVSPQSLTLSVLIEEKTVTRTFAVPVTYTGLPPLMLLQSAPDAVTVRLTGKYHALQALQNEDIRLSVPLSGLTAGTHQLTLPPPVLLSPVPGVTFEIQPEVISVTLSRS